MPPQVAAMARASGFGKPGAPSMPATTSSRPTRDRIATPFHAPCPWAATSYPRSDSSLPISSANASSASFVSCRHRTSGLRSSSHGSSRGTRCFSELTFQVTIRMPVSVGQARWFQAPARISIRNNVWSITMSIQSALVIGAGSGVGRATATALAETGAQVVAAGRERDATDPEQVAALLADADPDLVVVTAGTRPRMASIDEQTWESFSAPWNVDVKIAFEVGRAALARPLRPGSTVVIVSSGAGLNVNGSPLSGGYAGAKRMQMFLAAYLQRAADARDLGIRFVALAPMQFIEGTAIGEAAAAAYGAGSWPVPL